MKMQSSKWRNFIHRKFVRLAFVCVAMGLGSFSSAYALPLVTAPQAVGLLPEISAQVAGQVDFTAIIALDDCSGSLVRFTASLGTDLALVLTNGHCYEGRRFLKAGEVLSDVPSSRKFKLLNAQGTRSLGTLTASRVLYATMTRTDVTLYQLTETYDQIENEYGVRALTISSSHPRASTQIAVVSGYWKKIYSCSIDRFVNEVKEDVWTWRDSILYTPGCDTIGGTSGSPIIDVATGDVIGVNNTANEDGERCTLDNPCEVDGSGKVTVTEGARYGQETYLFYGCLGEDQSIDLNQPGCLLPK